MTDDLAVPLEDLEVAAPPLEQSEVDGLHRALETRTVIGQAVGILMVRRTLTAEGAFAHLVERSTHSNVKVRDLAAGIVAEFEDAIQQDRGLS